jgi:hypothetical protein
MDMVQQDPEVLVDPPDLEVLEEVEIEHMVENNHHN